MIGSSADPRENAAFETYQPPPSALVLTHGGGAIRIIRAKETTEVMPAPVSHVAGDYGAGDSFAGALTYFMGHGYSAEKASELAAPFGAAVLGGVDPLSMQRRLSV